MATKVKSLSDSEKASGDSVDVHEHVVVLENQGIHVPKTGFIAKVGYLTLCFFPSPSHAVLDVSYGVSSPMWINSVLKLVVSSE